MTAPPQLRAGPGPGDAGTAAAVIQTEALTKRYTSEVTALDGLTVAFAPGITGLVGANGAGKSTLIKILLGLLPPTSGRAVVLGHDAAASGERIRTLTGYMPEHDCLPPDVTGTEFVTHLGRMSGLPATAAKERAADSLRHVGLYEERYRQTRHLLHRHEAAGQAGPGPRRGPAAAAARRADHRPGPRRAPRRCST